MAATFRADAIVPEVDRADWFDLATARVKLVKGQVVFLDRLAALHDKAGAGGITA